MSDKKLSSPGSPSVDKGDAGSLGLFDSFFDNAFDFIPWGIGESARRFNRAAGPDADDRSQFAFFALLLFDSGSVCHNRRQILNINGHFIHGLASVGLYGHITL
jgi:hypothetical protein